jgi:hypothetical protein
MPLSSVVGASSILKPGVCTSSTRPAAPFEGQTIYETDTDLVKSYDGSSWVTIGPVTAAVTAIQSATVNTSQGTSSTSYTDLSTVGPEVTITTGTTALVTISATILQSGTDVGGVASFAVSGASTVSANDDNSISAIGTGVERYGQVSTSRTLLLSGLTAGSNVFTMKYKASSASTISFLRRSLTVMAL